MASSRISVRARHPSYVAHQFDFRFRSPSNRLAGTSRRALFQCDPTGPAHCGCAFEQKPILTRMAVIVGTFVLAPLVGAGTWLAINRPQVLDPGLVPSGPPKS